MYWVTGYCYELLTIKKCDLTFNVLYMINTGSMRQGDHFSQNKKKSEEPFIDIIDFK